jgi:hypothetical protein
MKKRIETERHLNRQELLRAARSGAVGEGHLKSCRECREMVELLKTYDLAGENQLVNAPRALIDRAIAITAGLSSVGKIKQRLVEILFDSWLIPHPVGVRGLESLSHRRLRFAIGNRMLDLRAEQTTDQWVFVAEVLGENIPEASIRLIAGQKTIPEHQSGLYQWTSKRPPKKLSLQIDNAVFELPELSWKKPRTT